MRPARVISLVPSLTETILNLGLPKEHLAGRTAWCIHPEAEVSSIPKLGGTKTPNLARIISLAPDLVVLDREENTRETYDHLCAAGISTWVCEVQRLAEVPAMLRDLARHIGCEPAGEQMAQELTALIEEAAAMRVETPCPVAVPLIWHDPLMAVAPSRYSADLVRAVGFDVPDFDPGGAGYPVVTIPDLVAAKVEWLLLTSEPHRFTREEGESLVAEMRALGCDPVPAFRLVDGEALTWFGSRSLRGLRWWIEFRRGLTSSQKD